jgi:xylulokinase
VVASTFLGIDLGTSSVKSVILDSTGSVLGQADADYPVDRPHPAWAETAPNAWGEAVITATRAALARAGGVQPVGVGLCGQMHGVVLSDETGEPVRPAVLWADARAEPQLEMYRALDASVRRRLANPLSPGMAGPILAWLGEHEPRSVAAARWALQPKDWIRSRLTGNFAAEPSDASATLLYDVYGRDWSAEIVEALGIPAELLPAIAPHSAIVAGALVDAAAHDLGLVPGIPVALGASDTAAAMLGAGLTEPGQVQLTIGTGVQIVTPTAAPGVDPAADPEPTTHLYRAATPHGWYAMAAGLTGGQTLAWVRKVLGAGWDELYDAASHPVRRGDPIFLPHLVGERTPFLDTEMRGAWTGLSAAHGRRELLYAALEGVAFAVADGLDALVGARPADFGLRLAGGGTVAPAWRGLLASILQADLYAVDVPAASARGAALLGAQAYDARTVIPDAARPSLVASPMHHALLVERRRRYQHQLQALRSRSRSSRALALE